MLKFIWKLIIGSLTFNGFLAIVFCSAKSVSLNN